MGKTNRSADKEGRVGRLRKLFTSPVASGRVRRSGAPLSRPPLLCHAGTSAAPGVGKFAAHRRKTAGLAHLPHSFTHSWCVGHGRRPRNAVPRFVPVPCLDGLHTTRRRVSQRNTETPFYHFQGLRLSGRNQNMRVFPQWHRHNLLSSPTHIGWCNVCRRTAPRTPRYGHCFLINSLSLSPSPGAA